MCAQNASGTDPFRVCEKLYSRIKGTTIWFSLLFSYLPLDVFQLRSTSAPGARAETRVCVWLVRAFAGYLVHTSQDVKIVLVKLQDCQSSLRSFRI